MKNINQEGTRSDDLHLYLNELQLSLDDWVKRLISYSFTWLIISRIKQKICATLKQYCTNFKLPRLNQYEYQDDYQKKSSTTNVNRSASFFYIFFHFFQLTFQFTFSSDVKSLLSILRISSTRSNSFNFFIRQFVFRFYGNSQFI